MKSIQVVLPHALWNWNWPHANHKHVHVNYCLMPQGGNKWLDQCKGESIGINTQYHYWYERTPIFTSSLLTQIKIYNLYLKLIKYWGVLMNITCKMKESLYNRVIICINIYHLNTIWILDIHPNLDNVTPSVSPKSVI